MAEYFEKDVQQHQKEIDFAIRYEEANVQQESARLFKAEHRRVFFDRVNAARKNLKNLAEQISPPGIEFFLQNSHEKINSFLRNVATAGRNLLKAKKNRQEEILDELPSIESLSAQLQVELDFIAEDVDKFRIIKAAEHDFEEAKNAEKNEAGLKGKMAKFDYLEQARNKLTHELYTPSTCKYYKELFHRIDEELISLEKELYALRLEYDPPAYIQMMKDDFEKEVRARISDQELRNKTIQRFYEGLGFYLGQLQSSDVGDRMRAASDVHDFMRKSLENISFDRVIVVCKGKTFECRYSPKLPSSEFEKTKQLVGNIAEIYLQNLEDRNVRLSEWNEDIHFENGVMKVRLDYQGRLSQLKAREKFFEFVVTPGALQLYDSSVEAETKKAKVELFTAAFEKWRNSPTSDSGFWYDNPPIYVDMEKYLKSKGVEKEDFEYEFFFQEPVDDFLSLVQFQDNGELIYMHTSNFTYAKDDLRNYPVERKILTYMPFLSDKRRTQTVEYYKPIELQEYKLVEKRYSAQLSRDQFQVDEYNKEGQMVRREIRLASCPGILGIYYDNGKPIADKNDMLLENARVVLEWTEAGQKKTFYSFSALKEKNSALTEEEYLNYTSQMLTSEALRHAWIQLMFEYTYDSPDIKDPLKKGSIKTTGNYYQTPEETVRRTINGKSMGDCDDLAFLFKDILTRQGKSAHVIYLPGHVITARLTHNHKSDTYSLFTYDTGGVTINGSPFDQNVSNVPGFPSKSEAIRTFQKAARLRGMPIRYFGLNPFPQYDLKSKDYVTVIEKIDEKDDIWDKTVHKRQDGLYKFIYLHDSFFPGIDAGNNFILSLRELPTWLHRKGEVYYALSVNPEWLKANEN